MISARDPTVGFRWELVSQELYVCSLRSCKREVWENYVARERASPRFWVMSLFLEKVHFAREFSMKNEFVAWVFSFMLRNRTAEGNNTSWVHCHNYQCYWRRQCTFTSCMNITKLSVSTSHPRGNHGWRFTARAQVSGGRCNRASIGAHIIYTFVSQKWWYLFRFPGNRAETCRKWLVETRISLG